MIAVFERADDFAHVHSGLRVMRADEGSAAGQGGRYLAFLRRPRAAAIEFGFRQASRRHALKDPMRLVSHALMAGCWSV